MIKSTIVSPQPLSIVVGVGVNINMVSGEADLINQPATSVFIESGQQLSVQSFLDRLLPTSPSGFRTGKDANYQLYTRLGEIVAST